MKQEVLKPNAIVKRIKKGLLHAKKYFKKWKVKLNENKTQAIIFPFNKSPRRILSMALSVDGAEIPFLDTSNYLGTELDKKLTFRHHIPKTYEKAIKCGRALFPLLN